MNKSATAVNGNTSVRAWIRRGHRWLGLVAILFVLLLTSTGIALNHSSDWQLDRRYVAWEWLLDAYGIKAPEPGPSFANGGHRATQLGRLMYFDARELPHQADSLTGLVIRERQVLVGTGDELLLLTLDGEFVDSIALAGSLGGPVERIGVHQGYVIVAGNNAFLRADADVANFDAWTPPAQGAVTWSEPSAPSADELAPLRNAYRGRGLTVERLLADAHSGRIVGLVGPALLDVVGIVLLLLALSGLVVWVQARNR